MENNTNININVDNNVSLKSQIGNKKAPNPIIIILIVAVVALVIFVGYKIYRKVNTTEIAVGLSDIELTDELKDSIKSVARDSAAYYDTNSKEMILTTQYGLLYSYKDKSNVIPENTSKNNNLSNKEMAESDVLLVKESDIVENGAQNLSIFVSVNTKEGYYVASPSGYERIFTEEEFRNLLMSYAPIHGEIKKPLRNSAEHSALMTAAGLNPADIDIKHISCDNKYAVIVCNEIKNPANIQEIALINNNNQWTVLDDELATAENSYISVNKLAPDMDLGLLPIYNISDFGEIQTDKMYEVADSLIGLGMMTEADKSTMYACGCDRFAYVQLESGKRLIGYINDDKQLEFNEAPSLESAISYMVNCQENPPVFIVKFE